MLPPGSGRMEMRRQTKHANKTYILASLLCASILCAVVVLARRLGLRRRLSVRYGGARTEERVATAACYLLAALICHVCNPRRSDARTSKQSSENTLAFQEVTAYVVCCSKWLPHVFAYVCTSRRCRLAEIRPRNVAHDPEN